MIPRLSQLRYLLVEGFPALAPLQILRHRTIQWRQWEVSLYILGASHAVQFTSSDGRFTELLACLPAQYANNPGLGVPLIVRDRLSEPREGAEETAAATDLVPGLSHRVRIECTSLDHDYLTDDYADCSISQLFPILPSEKLLTPPDGERTRLPVTRIGWRMEERSIHIETIHSYPEENQCLRTWSTYEEAAP